MLPKKISRATPDPGEAASWERTTTTSSFIWLDDDRSKLTNSLPETYCTAVNAISPQRSQLCADRRVRMRAPAPVPRTCSHRRARRMRRP